MATKVTATVVHHFTLVEGKRWEGLYHNGVLTVEAEKLTPRHVLHTAAFMVDMDDPGSITYEVRRTLNHGRFPRDLDAIKTAIPDPSETPVIHLRP